MQLQHIPGIAPLYTNTFLLITDAGHGIIIDAAAAPQTYLDALAEAGATLTHILLTHGHYDHVGAVAELKAKTGAKVYMDSRDAAGNHIMPLTPDLIDAEWPSDDTLQIDERVFRIYRTPGHTKGSVCLYTSGALFSGDTLFAGSCGRVDLPGGSIREMKASLSMLAALPLPDETNVYPGHEEFTTLGRERRSNPYLNGAWY